MWWIVTFLVLSCVADLAGHYFGFLVNSPIGGYIPMLKDAALGVAAVYFAVLGRSDK